MLTAVGPFALSAALHFRQMSKAWSQVTGANSFFRLPPMRSIGFCSRSSPYMIREEVALHAVQARSPPPAGLQVAMMRLVDRDRHLHPVPQKRQGALCH